MGLAASQGRLLTITARKANCEFQSMSLSHQKIALARDMDVISEQYKDAMNKTKLVYDFYGTGTSQMNLNYALLMTPSVYNDYFPRFLTDNSNRCVLSPEYAAAARAAGIPYEGFGATPSSEIRNAFVEALCDNGIITAATAVNIESVPYNNAVGLGELYSAQEATMEITYDELLQLIKTQCADTLDYGFQLSGTYEGSYPNSALLTNGSDSLDFFIYDYNSNDRQILSGNANSAVSLYDLLTTDKQYIFSISGARGDAKPITEGSFMQQAMVGNEYSPSFLNWMVEQFQSVLGGVKENDLALEYAYNQIFDLLGSAEYLDTRSEALLNDSEYWDDIQHRDHTSAEDVEAENALQTIGTHVIECNDHRKDRDVQDKAQEFIGFVYSSTNERVGRNAIHLNRSYSRATIAVDLNTVVSVFLTAYKEYLDGIENSSYSYEKGQTVNQDGANAILYTPKDSDVFTIAAPTDVNDGTESLVVSFYDTMFNMICTNGWTENEDINNAEYMQELLKNGAVYISSIDNDAHYYQSSYSTDTFIQKVSDTDAIAKAEAEYNAKKIQIDTKETTIDMKMKNLDTEISSLTTEYDTMKNVVNKAMEKSFKRYDA